MARQRPTLFEQIQDDERQQESSSGLTTSRSMRIGLIVVSILALVFFLPGGLSDSQNAAFDRSRIGTIWTEEPIVADYPFPVLKHPDSLAHEQRNARAAVPPYVIHISGAYQQAERTLTSAITSAPDSIAAVLRERGPAILKSLYERPIRSGNLDTSQYTVAVERTATNEESPIQLNGTVDSIAAVRMCELRLSDVPSTLRGYVLKALATSIIPTIRIDQPTWESERLRAEQGVATTLEIIHERDVIVRKGDRIDEHILSRLSAYRYAELARSNSRFSVLSALGSLGHAVVLIGMVVLFLFYVRRISFQRNGQLATLLAMPVVSAGLGWLSIALPSDLPFEYTIIVPGMAMLVSILYDVRTAIVIALVCSLSAAAARGNDHVTAVVLFVGGAMASYSATNLRSRTQIFTSILYIFAGLVIVTLSLEFERATALMPLLMKLAGSGVNAILSPLLALAVIVIMERTMNLATDLRLDDFDDINHPLIHQLNERAPGTYQHTMSVVNLSETAAAAIGANPLLVRVGALYHDIGKIEKSEYFIENQIDIENKHDRLSPKKSAAIIRQHVQAGIELAKDHGLPKRIWQFIPMHHGTMMIKHFYAKALEDAADGVHVDEQDYRYIGPRPTSKETAIVMLADAVEALSRLVNSQQREEIERAVDQIVLDRMMDGQLRDAPLTLGDIDTIKASFVKTLIGASHQRVRYKDIPEETDQGNT